ncbi:bifunctional uridylyltransferase/uridylyl-removing enzyme [Abditibacteriota bacterium]|nr:bifunctional uridylyltransferase/uridylyl-removing enzyme [Abditibacteriota bacterium]
MPPMHDTDAGLVPGSPAPDEQVTSYLRRYLPDFYFVNSPLSRMRRHMAILKELPDAPSGVIVSFYRAPRASFTELVLCARDEAQPGLLAKVAGTLVALGVGVHTAWIHSLDDPLGEGGTIVLDTLILSESLLGRSRALSTKTQKNLSNALTNVLNHEWTAQELLDNASRTRQRAARAPIEVSGLAVARAGDYTLFKLRAHQSNGALSRITRALAQMQIGVAHAQINTFEREVDDVFFVTDAQGLAFEDEEANRLLYQLRDALSRSE